MEGSIYSEMYTVFMSRETKFKIVNGMAMEYESYRPKMINRGGNLIFCFLDEHDFSSYVFIQCIS